MPVALLMIVLSQAADSHPVPPFAPRNVSAGVMVGQGAVSLQARLGWEVGLLEQPRNHLLAIAQVGSAFAIATPAGIRALYQHVALFGLAYQMPLKHFYWGFGIGFGPLWYRASYAPGLPYFFESRVLGYTEGRVELGFKLGEVMKLGAAVGYASPVSFSQRFPANSYVGGVMFSVVCNWR